jgi:hypothetical protein
VKRWATIRFAPAQNAAIENGLTAINSKMAPKYEWLNMCVYRLLLMAGNIYYYYNYYYCAYRYFAIVRPMQYSRKMTRNRANGLLIFAWCLGLVCALPPLFGWSAYVYTSIFHLSSLFLCSHLLFSLNMKNERHTRVARILAFNWCAQNLFPARHKSIDFACR